MKSFCTTALAALASLAWTADRAAAQYAPGYDAGRVALTSFNLPPTGQDPYGSMFTSDQPSTLVDPNDSPGEVLDGADGPTAFQEAVASEWGTCSECAAGGVWFGTAGALVMGRNRPNPYWTTYETNNNPNQLLNTGNAGADWTGGWQFTGGYLFGGGGCDTCCSNCYSPYGGCGVTGPGVAFTYWGLGQMPGFAQINSATNELSTPINLQTSTGDVEIGGQPASDFFDNSASHRIYREDRVNNFEANLFFGVWNYSRFTVVPFVGFRYFRFDERLSFGGLSGGSTWGANGGADEAYLSFRTVNNLFGGQVGTLANWWVTERFGIYAAPKLGLFGNQMNVRTRLYRGDGVSAYDLPAHMADFSVMGELDFGFNYFFRRNLFGYLGYRIVGVTNVALGDNQFLPYLADEHGFGQVKQSGSLILHGVTMGGGFFF